MKHFAVALLLQASLLSLLTAQRGTTAVLRDQVSSEINGLGCAYLLKQCQGGSQARQMSPCLGGSLPHTHREIWPCLPNHFIHLPGSLTHTEPWR